MIEKMAVPQLGLLKKKLDVDGPVSQKGILRKLDVDVEGIWVDWLKTY